MDEEVKGFNRYMSKVDFQPVTEFIFQNGQLTDYKKGEFFSRQNESCKMVGGNLGGSLGPLLVALLVAPYGRHHIALFAILALAAICVMFPICRWYRSYLNHLKKRPIHAKAYIERPLPVYRLHI